MGSYFSHSKKNAPEAEWQRIEQHAASVATIAAEFASAFNAEKWAFAAGMLHDLGKYRAPFQRMLRKETAKSKDTHHAIFGASVAFQTNLLPPAFAIKPVAPHAGRVD